MKFFLLLIDQLGSNDVNSRKLRTKRKLGVDVFAAMDRMDSKISCSRDDASERAT